MSSPLLACPRPSALLLAGALLWAAPMARAQQPETPAVITRTPTPTPGNWQLEQLSTPERSAPTPDAPPVPAAPAPPLPRPRPRPHAAQRGQSPIRLPQLAPESSPELRVRVAQPDSNTDVCEQIRAGTRRAIPGLDCNAAPLQREDAETPSAADPEAPIRRDGVPPASAARPAPSAGVPVPSRDGVQLGTPR